MLIIPKIKTVVVLVPRTGTGSLYRTVLSTYPDAMLLYRHMEADGIPQGYDQWRRVGVIRPPLERLWSMYKYCSKFGNSRRFQSDHVSRIRASVERPFSEWITDNEVVLCTPHDRDGSSLGNPHFSVRHELPENRKSQFVYVRPDLGTEVWCFNERLKLLGSLGLPDTHWENRTDNTKPPALTKAARDHIKNVFHWDLLQFKS